jgi:hypothetical protein
MAGPWLEYRPLASAFQPVQGHCKLRQRRACRHAEDNNAISGPAFKALFPWTTSTRRSRY